MGVPAFFRWLCARNPKALLEVLENSDESILSNNPDIDNLYLDMNGIIHPCSHPEQGGIPIPVTYDDMFVNVFHYIDRLVDIVRPKELIYMAIDGVAPRAKLNQQRSRRFRAAQESIRIQKEKERLRDYWKTQGLNSDALNTYIEKNFDSNQITPGTEFMQKLNIALQYYIYDRMNNNPLFRNILIIFNDSSIPGEGEHKILQFVRDQRKQMNYKTVRHCLYGADADLIMLGLSTHEPYFYVIRETIMANDDKQCSICQQKGHFFTDCKKREKVIDDLNGEIKQYNQIQQQQKNKVIQVDFQILQLNIVREFLYFETRDLQTSLKGQYDLERIIDDFVFMCFLVGNDFLPHIPCLKITEGGIDCLLIIYKTILSQIGDYLTNCGELNLQQMNQFLFHVGLIEDELIKGQEKKKEIVKNRRERNAEMKEQKVVMPPEFSIVDTSKEVLLKFKSALKEKLTEINQQEIDQAQSAKSSQELKKWKAVSYKQRYYQEKFGIKPSQFIEFQHRIKISYLEALAWTLKYYYQGCVDWGWFYPYHYAPFAQDLINLDQCIFEFQINTPFKPYQQLLAVLPPQSAQFLPRPYQQLMLETSSPIADFYPTDFVVDLKGKKFAWLGEVVLPFVDADRLIKASNIGITLSKLEQERDRLGQTLIFSAKKHEIFNFQVCHIQVQVEWLPRFPIGSEIKSPIPTMGNILNNQIISGALLKTVMESDPSFIQNQIRKGTIMPPEFLDEYYMNQCEQNKRSFGGEAVRRIIYSILGVKQVRRLDRSQEDFDQIKKQTKAINLGITSQYLDLQNKFQEEDPILHQYDHNNRPHALYFGNDLDLSKSLNRINMNSLKQEKQEVPIINEQEEDEPQIIKLTQKYLHELKIDSKQIYNYKKNFENENDLFMTNLDSAQVEQFQDNIQTQLEKADQCDGFELVIDCETCYGEIGLKVVDSLNDLQGNSKTPKIVISILDPNMNTKNRIINRSLTLTQYQENSTLLVPLELKEMQIHSKQLELNQQYSFLINNILSSYKCTQEYVSMHEFCKRITPAPQNNIFNILASIPSLQDKPENNILNYKQAKNLDKFYFSQEIINMNSERESYGESYFLRGISPFPNERNLKSYGVDIRILDYIYQVPQLYDYTDVMPFHSSIFSNESYKYTLLKLYKELNSIKKMGFLQYEKQSFEDDQQLKYDLCQLIENYGGIDEEEQL